MCQKVTFCYLVERLWPHPLQVGWRVFINVHSGAVLKRLPLCQLVIRLHSCNFPEILLGLGRFSIRPVLGVQRLPGQKQSSHKNNQSPSGLSFFLCVVIRFLKNTAGFQQKYRHKRLLYLIVKFHGFCKVRVGFGLEGGTSDRLCADFPTEDAAHNIIVRQVPVKSAKKNNQR